MKLSSRIVLMVMLELSLFAVDHQAPVLYVWQMQQPGFRVIGRVESKRSGTSELRGSPWKRTTMPRQEVSRNAVEDSSRTQVSEISDIGHSSGLEQEKREITLEDILMDNELQPNIKVMSDKQTTKVDVKSDKKTTKAKVKPNEKPRRKDKKKKKEDQDQDDDTKEITWPSGKYGLPRAASGCPWSEGFYWQIGFRFHDTEDDGTENQHSDSFHLAGEVSDDGIRHEFCMKTDSIGETRWPDGKYCIYKKGQQCPDGMDEGFVIWDDENKDNKNSKRGTLPEGHYDEDTKILFCCSGTGDWDQPIRLPRDRPFYLFAYEADKCQKVKGMHATREFLKFDDEDRGNIDYEGGEIPFGIHKTEKDHTLFLCYYTPISRPIAHEKDKKLHAIFKADKSSMNKKVDKLEEMEKLRNSEKMMDAFLASTAPHTEETDKSERTKTIIKTIRVSERVKDSTASIVATTMGIVLGAVLIGGFIMLIVSRRRADPSRADPDTMKDQTLTFTNSSRRSSYVTSDDEVEFTEGEYEDELVEDQYLPSDSELKSGLELMYFKQQRHYWTRNKKP